MKRKVSYLFGLLILIIVSCDSNVAQRSHDEFHPQNSERELLLQRQRQIIENSKKYDGFYDNMIHSKHSDDAINSLKIVENITIPKTKMKAIFYSYNLGTEIIRKTAYVINEDNKFYLHDEYFSSYDDDPYGNGEGEEGKKLLERIQKWESENKNIKWHR